MAKISKDNLDYLFDYGIDIKNRKIHLTGEVDSDMAASAVRGLDFLASISGDPITIILNSEGGDVDQGFAIYDAIKRCKCHITIIGTGPVMSMATVILQAADRRACTPNTTFMFHCVSASIYDSNPKSFKNWAKHVELANKLTCKIFGERSNKTVAYWERELVNDQIYTPDQVIELGLIDEIIED